MNRNTLNKISEIKDNVSNLYNTTTKTVNSRATETYNILSEVSDKISTVKNKISVLSDMFTDLRVLNGTAKNMLSLSSLPILENNGINIINDKFTLDTLIKTKKEFSIRDSSIASLEKYTLTDVNSKKSTTDAFLKYDIDTIVTFPTNRYTFKLNLRYTSLEQINNIQIQLGLLTKTYPTISSIKYIDKDNVEQSIVILNNNSVSYDLDYNREIDNIYSLDIVPVLTNQIIIEFTSKLDSSVCLKNIQTFFKQETTEGELILGPIHTDTSLLKIALDTEKLTTGCSFEFSTDLDYWLKLDSSSIIVDDTNTKILSFNTIKDNSIKSKEDIYTFYIKINISSSVLTNEDLPTEVYKTYREDNTVNNDTLSLVNENQLSAYRVKNSDFIYGGYSYVTSLNSSKLKLEEIEYIECDGVLKVIGLVPTKYSITNNLNEGLPLGSIGTELKIKRLDSDKVIDATTFDIANSVVYDIYPRQIEGVFNTKQKDNFCLYLKQKKKETTEEVKPSTEGSIFIKFSPEFQYRDIENEIRFNWVINVDGLLFEVSDVAIEDIIEENKSKLGLTSYYEVTEDGSGLVIKNITNKRKFITLTPSRSFINEMEFRYNNTASIDSNGVISFWLEANSEVINPEPNEPNEPIAPVVTKFAFTPIEGVTDTRTLQVRLDMFAVNGDATKISAPVLDWTGDGVIDMHYEVADHPWKIYQYVFPATAGELTITTQGGLNVCYVDEFEGSHRKDVIELPNQDVEVQISSANTDFDMPAVLPPKMKRIDNLIYGSFRFTDAKNSISKWDVSNVTSMKGFLSGCNLAKPNLSQWCVPLITSEPQLFGSPLMTAEDKPIWGTCPSAGGGGGISPMIISGGARGGSAELYSVSKLSIKAPTNVNVVYKDYTASMGIHYYSLQSSDGSEMTIEILPDTTGSQLGAIFLSNLPNILQWYSEGYERFDDPRGQFSGFKDAKSVPNVAPPKTTNYDYMFAGNSNILSELEQWDVRLATSMNYMFYAPQTLNLSRWCVSNITTQPSGWAGLDLIIPPIWGTCPNG